MGETGATSHRHGDEPGRTDVFGGRRKPQLDPDHLGRVVVSGRLVVFGCSVVLGRLVVFGCSVVLGRLVVFGRSVVLRRLATLGRPVAARRSVAARRPVPTGCLVPTG
ncbi:hypothetical protein JCM9957A_34440 [Kineosporia succinea]